MVAVRDVARFLKRPPAAIDVVLVHGPDAGRVEETCRAVVASVIEDPSDPFQLALIDAGELVSRPERLLEEAGAMSVFGGRKAVLVRVLDKPPDRAIKLLLEEPAGGNLVVLQAGELTRQSPLKSLCERSPRAAAILCAQAGVEANAALVDGLVKEAGLAIDPAARDDLVAALGEDRRQLRTEVEKLILYKEAGGRISSEDVAVLVVDANSVTFTEIVDAAFSGAFATLDLELSRALGLRMSVDPMLTMALRHAMALAAGRASIERGESTTGALGEMHVYGNRKDLVARQLDIWRGGTLDGVIADLVAACRRIRVSAQAAESVARMTLWRVARRAHAASARHTAARR